MSDLEIVQALAAASRAHDAILANVLATEAENRMRRAGVAAASAPECIMTIDACGMVVYVNDAVVKLLGCARRDLIGRLAWDAIDVYFPGGERMPKDARPSFAALQGGREARGEVDVRCADGARVRCVYLAAPVIREGMVDGAVVVFHRADA